MKVLEFPSKTTPYRIVVPLDGKRKSLYFATRDEADKKLRELKKFGVGILRDPNQVRASQQIDETSNHWRYLADKYELSVGQITQALERYVATLKLNRVTVREAIEGFCAARKSEVSKGTVNTDRNRLVFLVRKYGHSQMTDLSKDSLIELIKAHGNGARSIYKSVAVFLKWSVEKKYLLENPLADVEAKKFGQYGVNNEFYPVTTFRRMLRVAAGLEPVTPGELPTREFIDLLPVMVLGGFAGLRPCEAYRTDRDADAVKWTDLYFSGVERPHLDVREPVAKQTRRESGDARPMNFGPGLDALEDWLALCPRYDGNPFVVRWTRKKMNEIKTAFTAATGIKFLDNGFRNSFGTYMFSFSGEHGLGQVAKQMGNSEAIARRHYVKNLPTGTGAAWFALRPLEIVQAARKEAA